MEVGLWIKDAAGLECVLVKDCRGYPSLRSLGPAACGEREEGIRLYQELTGNPYPHQEATRRQVLWDLLEAALPRLP